MTNNTAQEDKLDLVALVGTLWKRKRLYLITGGVAAVLGLIIGLSTPNSYTTKVTLAPEVNSGNALSGGIGDIASMMGINLGGAGGSVDAIYPEIYPQILNSTPFLTRLFSVKVSTLDGSVKDIDMYHFIAQHTKYTWWAKIMGSVAKLFKKKPKGGGTAGQNAVDNFKLTPEQFEISQALKGMMSCTVDKKTSVISFSVTTQDPQVSALLADSIQSLLLDYVIDYRTKKARTDYEYYRDLSAKAKANYVKAQQLYSSFSDANTEVNLQSVRSKQEELENEMQLQYNTYSQISQQMQLARAKIQERTPVFTQIQPATVPSRKSAPKRMTIVLVMVLMAAIFTSIYILINDARKK